MIDDQNMKRKKYCTDQDEQFAPSDGEALTWCQAEKIQATQVTPKTENSSAKTGSTSGFCR